MENGEGPSKFGKLKKILQAGILTSALLGSRGGGITQGANAQDSDNQAYSQSQQLDHKIIIPNVARDEKVHSPEEFAEIEFTELTSEIKSGFETAVITIIKDQQTFEEYWKKMNQDPNMPAPKLKEGEVIILSALGNKDTLTATLIKKVEKNSASIRIDTESYDVGHDVPEISSPFDSVSVEGVDSSLPLILSDTKMPGKYDFSITTSSRTDSEGTSINSGKTVSVEPRQ